MKNKKLVLLGLLLILVSVVFTLEILGVIPGQLASILISWQALLVLIGLISLYYRAFFQAGVLIVTGIYFLLPELYTAFDYYPTLTNETMRQLYWVTILLIAGLSLIFIRFNRWENVKSNYLRFASERSTRADGVVDIKVVFGGMQHLVIEKPFKGAKISTIFGGSVLDLRNTVLAAKNAVVDIECVFAGTIILVPDGWRVTNSTRAVFGGVVDKRDRQQGTNADHELVITGNVTFGGVEIRNMLEKESGMEQFRSYEYPEQVANVEDIIENISVKLNNKVHILSTDEVSYIQADGDYVTIHTPDGKFLKEQTMKYFESALPSDKFIRVHRSYLVNMSQINCVESRGREVYYVILKDGTALRTSTSGYQLLKSKLSI